MNSNFNKSMLWVVMLSAISQAYPMSNAAKLAGKAGVAAAFAMPSAGAAFALGRHANMSTTFAEQGSVVTEQVASEVVPAVVEAPISAVNQEITQELGEIIDATAKAKTIAQRASEKVAQGKTVIINSYTSCKSFVVDKATDKEFLAQGFCGMVTVGSISYLVHKSGVAVKVKKNWKNALKAVGVTAVVLGTASFMYPEVALNVAGSALNIATNPYTALAAGAAAASYGVSQKFTNKYAKATSAASVVAAAGLVGGLNRYGFLDTTKTALSNGVSYAANKVKDGAIWTAQKGYDYVAKPVYDYTVAPVVEQAVKHPYIAGGVATAVAVPVVGFGAYKGVQAYKAWKTPAKNKRRVIAPVTAPVRVPQTNTAPAAQPQAPQSYVAQAQKAMKNKLNGVTAAKAALIVIVDNVAKNLAFAPGEEAVMDKHIAFLKTKGIDISNKIAELKRALNSYPKAADRSNSKVIALRNITTTFPQAIKQLLK